MFHFRLISFYFCLDDQFTIWLLLFSHLVIPISLQSHGLLYAWASLSLTISHTMPKFMAILSVMQPSYLILWHPLPLLPSIFPSIRDFSNELTVCIRWPNCWHFSFSISPSNEFSRLISFKIDWFDLLAVYETLGTLLHQHSLKALILWCPAFFMV